MYRFFENQIKIIENREFPIATKYRPGIVKQLSLL